MRGICGLPDALSANIEDEKMMGGPFKPSVGLSGMVSVDGIALQ
jgi:hypothetical protein